MRKRVTGLLLALCLCLTLLPGTAGAAYEPPKEVSQVTLSVTPPAVGSALTAPTVDSNEPYFIDNPYSLDDIDMNIFYWKRVAAEGCTASAGYLYEEGGTSLVNNSWYRMQVKLLLDYGYVYGKSVTGTIPGAELVEVERYKDDAIYLSAWFKVGDPPEFPTAVSTVTLTDVPTTRMDKVADWADAIQKAAVSDGCQICYASLRKWDSADDMWRYSDSSGSTDASKVYGAMLTINPLPNHVFANAVIATVNGSAAEVAECDLDEVVVFVPFGKVTIDKAEVESDTWPIDGNTIRKDAGNFTLNEVYGAERYPYTLKSAKFQIEENDAWRDLTDREILFSGAGNYRVTAVLRAKSYAAFADTVAGDFNGTKGTECEITDDGTTCIVTRSCAVYDSIYTYNVNTPYQHVNGVDVYRPDPAAGQPCELGEFAPTAGQVKLRGGDANTGWYEVPCVGSTTKLKTLKAGDAFEADKVYLSTVTLSNLDDYRFGEGFTVSFKQLDGSDSDCARLECVGDTARRKEYNVWYTVGDRAEQAITNVTITGPEFQNGTIDTSDPSQFRTDDSVTLGTPSFNPYLNQLSFNMVAKSGNYFGRTVSVTYNGKPAAISDTWLGSRFDTKSVRVSYDTTPATPVTVTGVGAVGKVYDGTTNAELDITHAVLSGVEANDDVTLDLSGVTAAFADQNAGTGKTVTVTGQFKLTGKDASKYTLTQPDLRNLTADITACETFTDATNKDQTIYVGESGFAAPKFTGVTVNGVTETVIGDVTYKVGNDTKTAAEISEGLKSLKAGEQLEIGYTFTADGNYSGTKTGTITVTAQERPAPGTSGSVRYDVTVAKADHGTVSASAARAAAGDTVTLTAQPDSGYVLAALTVTDSQGREIKLTRLDGGKYTFTMPGNRVEVKAAFAGITFSDVPSGAYYAEAVRWAVEQGVTNGTGDGTFQPNGSCTRAQLAAFLWRLAGEPESTQDPTFTDVSADAWCAKALRWAAEQGIVTGYADGSFHPDQTVTRIQAVAMLYRYAKAQGMDTTRGGMAVREFDDFAAVPAYALEAAGWAVNAGVLRGAGNRLMPNDPCTRAQIVTFLYRAMQGK